MAISPSTTSMVFDRKNLDDTFLLEMYHRLLKPRMIEEKMLKLLRQGRISKWFSGIGQEAIAVGAASVLNSEEFIFPMHRNLGVFTTRAVPLERLFAQFQGKPMGFTNGRDRSFHFGAPEYKIIGMISHLGAQLSLADGIGMADQLENKKQVTIAFSGDGGTSEGEFHEALNVAAVWDLPVIFLVENNGYGLSTPSSQQFKCAQIADKGIGYGMESVIIDGNNILEVYHKLNEVAESIRNNPRPVLVECMTFRMRGHEEASGVKYVPKELIEEWGLKDPLDNYESWLMAEGILSEDQIEKARAEYKAEIEEGLEIAFAAEKPLVDKEKELADVYVQSTVPSVAPSAIKEEKRFVDALSDGLLESMRRHDNLVIMGQDIAEYGGVFKITDGFLEEFGAGRVRNTPICESAIIGAGLGLAIRGWKSVIEMQFADFVSCGFNQIVNNLAKVHYRWGQAAEVVVRMPCGGGVAAGPFHSQSNEAWFAKTPGLKIVYPSTPEDAKGLLAAAIEDPNPVLYFEHKALYRSLTSQVPQGYYTTPIGKARTAQSGEDITIITYGIGVHWALKAIADKPAISAEILDMRSLAPIDWDAIKTAVEKTGKVIVLHEDTMTCGIGAEVAAWVSEHCFEALDAPVKRVASLDTPIPFAAELENQFMASSRLTEAINNLVEY
ncbi:MAG: 2-oxoisovalerate dehydrogenase E1 component [Limisphaerales bacterium]|jgi:2-oxoisovalerate dehydrogenase E1 component